MATVKGEYLKKIIAGADEQRYKEGKSQIKDDHIMISDSWLEELTKYPFISSKVWSFIIIEKPGKAIFLMKERSKLIRVKKNGRKHELAERLGGSMIVDEEVKDDQP